MTIPVISSLPEIPAYSDANFETKAPAVLSALRNTFIAEMNAAIAAINNYDYGAAVNANIIIGQVAVANGGTGLSELAAGRIPYGDVANPLASDSNFTYSDKALTQYRYRRTNSDAISIPTGGTYYKIATIEPTVGNNSGSRIVITVNANCRWNSNNSRQTAVFVYAVGRDTIQLIKASTNVYGGLGSIPIPEESGGVITIAARNAASTTSGEAYVFVEEYASLAAFAEINFLTPTDVGDSSAFLADDCEFFLHKIGIGTTTPAKKLEVKDDSGAQLKLTDSAGNYVDFGADSNGDLEISPSAGVAAAAGAASGSYLRIKIGSTFYKIALLADS